MGAPTVTVDVRDMLCAQALAVVAKALGRLTDDRPVDVLFTTEDVQRDVLVWAKEGGHRASVRAPGVLRLRKGTL